MMRSATKLGSRRWSQLACAGAAALTALATSASAAVTFRYATDQLEYHIAPGESAVVVLKLIEERDSEADASVLLTEGGVIGYDLKIERASGTALITGAAANMEQFDDPFSSVQLPEALPTGGSPTLEYAVLSLDNPGPTGTQNGSLVREITLGTVTITATHLSEASVYNVVNSSYFGSNTITNLENVLDGQVQGAQFTIQVPEPAMTAIISCGAVLLCSRRRVSRSSLDS